MRPNDEIAMDLKNEYRQTLMNVLLTGNWIDIQTTKVLRPFKISLTQYNILKILENIHPKPSTLKKVQSQLIDPISNGSRNIHKLTLMGLIEKEFDSIDKRQLKLRISTKGKNLLKKMDNVIDEKIGNSQELSGQDLIVANQVLDKLRTIY